MADCEQARTRMKGTADVQEQEENLGVEGLGHLNRTTAQRIV